MSLPARTGELRTPPSPPPGPRLVASGCLDSKGGIRPAGHRYQKYPDQESVVSLTVSIGLQIPRRSTADGSEALVYDSMARPGDIRKPGAPQLGLRVDYSTTGSRVGISAGSARTLRLGRTLVRGLLAIRSTAVTTAVARTDAAAVTTNRRRCNTPVLDGQVASPPFNVIWHRNRFHT